MDLDIIKRLVKLVEKSAVEELKIEEKDFKVCITKSKGSGAPLQTTMQIPVSQPAPQVADFPHIHQEAPVHETKSDTGKGEDGLLEVCSPMVGTFYRAPSPDAAPYVKEGDDIQPGKILCIIEAMKLMNELEAEISGKIVKILVENGEPVEFNQPLFLVK